MKYRNYRFIQYISIVLFFSLVSCEKDDVEPRKTRTLMVYLVGQNETTISRYLQDNIKDMAGVWEESYNGDIVIYYHASGAAPKLLTFKMKKGVAEQDVLKTYDKDLNSASPETLKQVIKDMQALYPSDSYGMIFGGHASGWLTEEFSRSVMRSGSYLENAITRSFADPVGMDIREMAKAIPANGMDFILFDACLMSSVEALYEFRNKTKYIIACPTETQIQGFPYGDIMTFFWGKGADLEKDLKDLCETYYKYYNTYDHSSHFGSIALINTAELDNLYDLTQRILSGRASEAAKIDPSDVNCMPKIGYPNYYVFFDLMEYIKFMAPDKSFIEAYEKQLDKVILYDAITEYFNNKKMSVDKFSGITTYIPISGSTWDAFTAAYWGFEWAGVYDAD